MFHGWTRNQTIYYNGTREELEYWVKGICDGNIPDYQLTAWLMLVCMNGMNFEETAILTELFAKSGSMR